MQVELILSIFNCEGNGNWPIAFALFPPSPSLTISSFYILIVRRYFGIMNDRLRACEQQVFMLEQLTMIDQDYRWQLQDPDLNKCNATNNKVEADVGHSLITIIISYFCSHISYNQHLELQRSDGASQIQYATFAQSLDAEIAKNIVAVQPKDHNARYNYIDNCDYRIRAVRSIFGLHPMIFIFRDGEERWEGYFSFCERVEDARL
ncbi:hypothetical protein IEQ34_012430 [Dendrobium chrysotoxum]|uniref:Uncharacterized protein n=1 Tax=Dendrobium chrysotoxum TaxID=161865 RepID=A0AAV7GSE9_DENCH|nr:hypothetical protein IEQ34_012430 [Dendrobium chrysotoxum]